MVENSTRENAVVVCIPTCRRPEKLAALLRALKLQTFAEPFSILVGNNDSRDLDTYPVLADPDLPPRTVIAVATPGVSAVRNALVAAALHAPEPPAWIAFIDDDQVPAPDWLAALVATGRRHAADIAGGPVRLVAEVETLFARAAVDKPYLPKAEGPTGMLNECGNLLLSTAFLARFGREPFSADFARTGGEDYEFFLAALARGARLVWAPDAHVTEAVPLSRLTAKGFAWRSYSTAASQSRADLRHLGTGPLIAKIARELAGTPVAAARALTRERDWKLAAGLVFHRLSCSTGRVVGLFGTRAERYGGPDPVPSRETAR